MLIHFSTAFKSELARPNRKQVMNMLTEEEKRVMTEEEKVEQELKNSVLIAEYKRASVSAVKYMVYAYEAMNSVQLAKQSFTMQYHASIADIRVWLANQHLQALHCSAMWGIEGYRVALAALNSALDEYYEYLRKARACVGAVAYLRSIVDNNTVKQRSERTVVGHQYATAVYKEQLAAIIGWMDELDEITNADCNLLHDELIAFMNGGYIFDTLLPRTPAILYVSIPTVHVVKEEIVEWIRKKDPELYATVPGSLIQITA
jgi:hypothetical protein